MAEPRNVTMIVTGHPPVIVYCVPRYFPVQGLRNEALWKTNNMGYAPDEWEVRNEVGEIVRPETKVGELKYDGPLYLKMKPGAMGGQ